MIAVMVILLTWISWGIDEPALNSENPLQGKFGALTY
jgi:hypothetical protein